MNYAFISYGLGGAAVEWWSNGLRLLCERCRAIGIDTRNSPYKWSDVNEIAAEIDHVPSASKIAVGGASLGDDEAPDIARRVHRKIDYLFGFQDSEYGVNVAVPDNVLVADNIYDPVWWHTFGLGSRKWVKAPRNETTKLRNIPIMASHPDDWGIAQDIIFSQIHRILADGKYS